MIPDWDTSCVDWERRIVAGESLCTCPVLFPDQAEAAMRWFTRLHLVDVAGSPTIGQVARPWIIDLANVIFGSYDAETGERLINNYFLLVSKKNGKSSPIASGIMLTALLMNWRYSAEFIILAPTVEVANNSFGPAKDMVHADEILDANLHVQPHFRTITHKTTKAVLKVIAADSESVSGKKATGVLIEELWLFGKRANAENMLIEATGGLGSRPEGFVFSISTHSDEQPAGVFASTLKEFRDIRDGRVRDPRSFGLIYEYPKKMLEEEAYRDPDKWYITNPNLDASVSKTFLEQRYARAERKGLAEFRAFAAKHLNVEIGIALRADGWAGANYWDRGTDPEITLEYILATSEVVTIGIDGGGLDDLLGIAVLGRHKTTKKWLLWTHAFISPEGEERRKINATIYKDFMRDGDLTRVDHLPNDLIEVSKIVERVKDSNLLYCVGVDKIGIGGIVDAMNDIDVTEDTGMMKSVSQGISLMGAIKTVERKLADGTFLHGGQNMMKWCVGNAKVIYTPTAMRLERGETGAGKIDPLAATFNAAELMMSNPNVAPKIPQIFFFGGARPKQMADVNV